MAINFPDSPAVNDTFTNGLTAWTWDGTSWNITYNAFTGVMQVDYGTITGATSTVTSSYDYGSLT
jgi:hypothetical protein